MLIYGTPKGIPISLGSREASGGTRPNMNKAEFSATKTHREHNDV